jgi:hypothetical protein
MGIVLLYIGGSQPATLRAHWRQLRHRTLRGYLENPASVVILLAVLGLLFICLSDLLAQVDHWPLILLLTAGGFVFFFLVFHLSRHRWVRYSLVIILLIGLGTQSYFFVKHRGDHIVSNRFGLTVYRGIAIPFFDVIIFPNGTFRPAPKKHLFSLRDQRFFLRQETDIILIGSGTHGRGGRGFPEQAISQFMFNPFTNDGTQVIILPNAEACQLFNRLKHEKKDVLFVLHNTC